MAGDYSDKVAAIVADVRVQGIARDAEAVLRAGQSGLLDESPGEKGRLVAAYVEHEGKEVLKTTMQERQLTFDEKKGVNEKGLQSDIIAALSKQIGEALEARPAMDDSDRAIMQKLVVRALAEYNKLHPGEEGANPPNVRPPGSKQSAKSRP